MVEEAAVDPTSSLSALFHHTHAGLILITPAIRYARTRRKQILSIRWQVTQVGTSALKSKSMEASIHLAAFLVHLLGKEVVEPVINVDRYPSGVSDLWVRRCKCQ